MQKIKQQQIYLLQNKVYLWKEYRSFYLVGDKKDSDKAVFYVNEGHALHSNERNNALKLISSKQT